jgi:hypothetical protein
MPKRGAGSSPQSSIPSGSSRIGLATPTPVSYPEGAAAFVSWLGQRRFAEKPREPSQKRNPTPRPCDRSCSYLECEEALRWATAKLPIKDSVQRDGRVAIAGVHHYHAGCSP